MNPLSIPWPSQSLTGKIFRDQQQMPRASGREKLPLTGEIDYEILLESYQVSTWSNTTVISVYENGATVPAWTKTIQVN